MNWELFYQYLVSGLIMGTIYCLMGLGITFIYSLMKMINWSMGEFYMLGSYIQYFLVVYLLGPEYWYVGVIIAMAGTFVVGILVERSVIRPMFTGIVERSNEYATIVTVTMMLLFRNLAIGFVGPYVYSPPGYYRVVHLGSLPINGSKFAAFLGTFFILCAFFLFIKKTWYGRALRGSSQNRLSIQIAGIDVLNMDQLGFGVGVALAAAAGALLAPVYLAYPECGAISTMKGFEIMIIGGLGSVPGVFVAGLLLGVVESMGSFFISSSFRDVYGFVLLLVLLAIRPQGLFGERERLA